MKKHIIYILILLLFSFSCREKMRLNDTLTISFNNQTDNNILLISKDSLMNRKGKIELVMSYYNHTYKRNFKKLDEGFINAYERKEIAVIKKTNNYTYYIISNQYLNSTYEELLNNRKYDSINLKSDLNKINLISIEYFPEKTLIDYLE